MASQSEKTFGSRLFNAEQMATNVATYRDYVAVTPETAIEPYNELIAEIVRNNSLVAAAESEFSLAIDIRKNKFQKSATSLEKTLSPILSYVKARFGKKSKQVADITSLVNKIRGEKTTKLKRNEEGEFVSNSHRTYGSQTQYFADIISILTSYERDYAPTNPNITIEKLNLQHAGLIAANAAVTTTFGQVKPAKDLRDFQYDDLTKRSQTIKEAVKSQYGVQSTEYRLIKGLKI